MNQEQLAQIRKPKQIEGDVILSTGPLLGLGDHSVFTTLPERFAKLGHDVYLDKDIATSNPQIGEALWQANPYIKDLTDRKPNAGYVRQGLFYDIANRIPGYRSIEAMERAHALPSPYSIAPKLYYTPRPPFMDVSNKILMDYSSVSSKIGMRGLEEAVKMSRERWYDPHFLQILHAKHVSFHAPPISAESYQVASIYEYLDLLAACKAWVGSEAGGQALASAVRGEHDVYEEGVRPEVWCTITPPTFNSRGYTFRNVNYHVTSDTDGTMDFWAPSEVATMKYTQQCEIRKIEAEERLHAGR